MRIGIIGSGPSGLYLSIFLKIKHQDFDVVVFDKEQKLGKKLYATGNGRCNLLNKNLSGKAYNHERQMDSLLKAYPYEYLDKVLKSIGVQTTEIGDYVYPLTMSAPTYTQYLIKLAERVGVKLVSETKIVGYEQKQNQYVLRCEGGKEQLVDKVVIACGGCSSPKLGSDGSFFKEIKKHGYKVIEPRPGLTPLVLADRDIKDLPGIRHDAKVEAYVDEKKIFEEVGEVLYKNDGISGIVIFNAESAIYRLDSFANAELVVDLFPERSEKELEDMLLHDESINHDFYLDSYLLPALQKHVLGRAKKKDAYSLAKAMKHLKYTVKNHYGFDSSQVTIGGVALEELSGNLESTKEKGVFFVGEVVDIDGNCGGYNLTWDLISAMLVYQAL